MAETPAKQRSTVSDMFVLHGYSMVKGIGVGKYIASDEFTVGGYKWAIYFFPDGKSPDDNFNLTYISVYIALMSEGEDVQPLFELTLMDQSGKGKHRLHTRFTRPLTSTPQPATRRMWGYDKYFRRDVLETSDYLLDDCLKIYYTVEVAISDQMADRIPNESLLARSCSITETRNGSNLFVIQGYSMAKGIGVGNYIASNEFSVGVYKWVIHFFPDGNNPEDNTTSGSVGIKLLSEGRDVRALFEFTLMDQTGKGKHKLRSGFNDKLNAYTLRRGSTWGYDNFFTRPKLEMSDYLRDDCWKIYCTVAVVSAIDYSRLRSIQVPDSDIGSHIDMLLQNMEGCDITFNVSGEKLHAHKLILAARSPKLRSELVEGVDANEVMVADMEPKVFKALLRFIYTDALAEKEVISSAHSVIADSLTAKLLAAADRYELERLKRLCESHLCKFITINSVIDLLVLADCCHAAELKDVCLKFAAKNLTAVMRSDGFKHLEENSPSLKSEFLNSVGGREADCCNGGDNSGQRVVRQRIEEGTSAEVELEGFKCLEIGT